MTLDTMASGPGSGKRSRRSANARARAIPAQSIETPSGGDYGDRKATVDAQRAIPLPDQAAAQQADLATALAAAQQTQPPSGGLAAPTTRPGEPVTSGLASGPGSGPQALGAGPEAPSDADLAHALYRRFPTEAMRKLVERADRDSGLDREPPGRKWMMTPLPMHPGGTRVAVEQASAQTPWPTSDEADADKPYEGNAERRKGGRNSPRRVPGAEGLYQHTDG